MVQDLERVLKAAADASRLRILRILDRGELCICQIVEVLGLSQSTVSKHLRLLKNAGLVEEEKRGKWAFYRLAPQNRSGAPGALGLLLADSLRRERGLADDLRNLRLPRVKRLARC